MRASLPHTLRERRRARAGRHPRTAVGAPEASRAAVPTKKRAPAPAAPAPAPTAHVVDQDVQRVRDAGGPLDEASYTCQCGFVFRAPVSTTVACPHCHAPQAW
jgi:hypothetical protein